MSYDFRAISWFEATLEMDRMLRIFHDYLKPVLQKHGAASMSMSNIFFLMNIGSEPTKVNEILKKGHYMPSNGSYALKTLENAGYIVRSQNEADKRNAIISYSDNGKKLIDDIKEACSQRTTAPKEICRILQIFETHCSTGLSK